MSVIPKKNSCDHFFSVCFEILTWYLVCRCIMICYRPSLRFVPVQWSLAELWSLDFEIWPNILKFGQIFSCHHFFSLCFEILTWYLVCGCIMISYRSSLHFVPVQWFLAELWPLDFEIWPNIWMSPLYFTMIWDIDLIFGMRVYNHKLHINFEIHLLFLAYYWGN